LTVIALIQIAGWILALRFTFLPCVNHESKIAFFTLSTSLCLLSPFFYASTLNVLRTGIAVPLVMLGMGFAQKHRPIHAGVVWALATAIQLPTALSVVAAYLVFSRASVRMCLWTISLLALAYGLAISLFVVQATVGNWGDLGAMLQVGDGTRYRSGVRLDFLAAGVFAFSFLAWLTRRNVRHVHIVRMLSSLLAPFLLVGWTDFSDRWLLSFWLVAPFLLAVGVSDRLQPRAVWVAGVTLVPFAALTFVSRVGLI